MLAAQCLCILIEHSVVMLSDQVPMSDLGRGAVDHFITYTVTMDGRFTSQIMQQLSLFVNLFQCTLYRRAENGNLDTRSSTY